MNKTLTNNEFLTIVQNKSFYRKDNIVRNLANKTTKSIFYNHTPNLAINTLP